MYYYQLIETGLTVLYTPNQNYKATSKISLKNDYGLYYHPEKRYPWVSIGYFHITSWLGKRHQSDTWQIGSIYELRFV